MSKVKKAVYGYIRVSTVEQAETGDSLETQEKKIREYCERKNLNLLQIFCDKGISGATPPHERKEMSILLNNLEAGKATGMVACKIDRISRCQKDFTILMYDFKDKWDFYCLEPDLDGTTLTGKIVINFMSMLAEIERDMTKARVKEVLSMKRAKGERIGAIPFGKRLIAGTNILEDDPEEQRTIMMAKELRELKYIHPVSKKTTSMTFKAICDELVKKGRKNKDGSSSFFPSQIRRMINDGNYKSGRSEQKAH